MKNLILIICLSLWFPSCGYKPLYKVNKKILNYQINVIVTTQQRSIDESMERDKQLLRNFIKSKLNMPNSKPSSLKLIIEMNKSLYGMGIQKDLTTTRNAISYNLSYKFYDKLGEIQRGSLQKSSSYNIGKNPYASLRAEETSSKNLLKSLANEVALMISTTPKARKVIYP